MFDFQSFILGILPPDRRDTPRGWVKFNCPCCERTGEPSPDRLGRGGVKFEPNGGVRYYCFRCGTSASWQAGQSIGRRMEFVLDAMGVSASQISKLKFDAYRSRAAGIVTAPCVAPVRPPSFAPVSLPPEAQPLVWWLDNDPRDDAREVAEYLIGRGAAVANGWNYYWSPQERGAVKLNRRVIVPFWHHGTAVGWTARLIDPPDPNGPPRYHNSGNQPRFLFNAEALTRPEQTYVVIVEGAFDAIAIDGIAVLSNTISAAQAKWINDSGRTPVVLPDLGLGRKSLIDAAHQYEWACSFPWDHPLQPGVWENDVKDAAEASRRYGKIYTVKSILTRIITNPGKVPMLRDAMKRLL